MLVICYLFCVCVYRFSTELMLYVVLTMPTLNKAYLFMYLLFITDASHDLIISVRNNIMYLSIVH